MEYLMPLRMADSGTPLWVETFDGSFEPLEVLTESEVIEAKYGTKGAASGRKWYVCSICGLERPEDEVIIRSGKVYCEEDFEDFIADRGKK